MARALLVAVRICGRFTLDRAVGVVSILHGDCENLLGGVGKIALDLSSDRVAVERFASLHLVSTRPL